MDIKVDLAKAFDMVEWSMLICILKNLGYNDQFINCIHECISSSNLSFLVNGSLLVTSNLLEALDKVTLSLLSSL